MVEWDLSDSSPPLCPAADTHLAQAGCHATQRATSHRPGSCCLLFSPCLDRRSKGMNRWSWCWLCEVNTAGSRRRCSFWRRRYYAADVLWLSDRRGRLPAPARDRGAKFSWACTNFKSNFQEKNAICMRVKTRHKQNIVAVLRGKCMAWLRASWWWHLCCHVRPTFVAPPMADCASCASTTTLNPPVPDQHFPLEKHNHRWFQEINHWSSKNPWFHYVAEPKARH